jgi:hypothetical protein
MRLTKAQIRRFIGKGHITALTEPRDLSTKTDAKKHPVTLYKMSLRRWNDDGTSMAECQSHYLLCRCDIEFKIKWFKIEGGKRRRYREQVRDAFSCAAKQRSRAAFRKSLGMANAERWGAMSIPERIADIWRMHRSGEYLGEHNEGTIYAQEIEEILSGPSDILMPSGEFMSALSELEKRKLIRLNGMILVPYIEYFQFPKQLHGLIAMAVEEPLGWPNGEAGDFFLYRVYGEISKMSGWTCGEDVFGEANIPALTFPDAKEVAHRWLLKLDPRLKRGGDVDERAAILHALTTEQWVAWLHEIKDELSGVDPKKT